MKCCCNCFAIAVIFNYIRLLAGRNDGATKNYTTSYGLPRSDKKGDFLKHAMVLTQLRPGEWARIVAIEGGRGLRQKLLLRGLFEGSIVRVISKHGPITVEVGRNIVSIGRGMAQKVRVRRI